MSYITQRKRNKATYVVFPQPVGPIRAFIPGSKMPLKYTSINCYLKLKIKLKNRAPSIYAAANGCRAPSGHSELAASNRNGSSAVGAKCDQRP